MGNEENELEWVAVEISQLNFELNCVYSAAKRRKNRKNKKRKHERVNCLR